MSGHWDTRHYVLTQSYQINDDKKEISQKEAYDLGLLNPNIYLRRQELLNNHTVQIIIQ